MVVDYHVHLEEGPYSFRWLNRVNDAFNYFSKTNELAHTKKWLRKNVQRVLKTVENGPYHSDWLDLYLIQAKKKGLKEVGIVDHLYKFRETLPYYYKHVLINNSYLGDIQKKWLQQVSCESMDSFLTFINSGKEKWAKNGVELKIGLETDYFLNGEEELEKLINKGEWDFVIGSVHFLDGWGFDNPETKHLFNDYDINELYDRFFYTVNNAISSNLFDFIAHLDNLKCFGYLPNEATLQSHYNKIAQSLVTHDVATEINSGLRYRFPIEEACPSNSFLNVLIDLGVAITTSSDAHFPDDLGKFVHESTNYLREKGVNEIATFTNRERVMKAL